MPDNDHSYMRQTEYVNNYPQVTHIAESIPDKYLYYYPKLWSSGELIDAIDMNNIEQGIQIALASRTSMEEIAEEAVSTIVQAKREIEDSLSTIQSNLTNNVNSQLNTQNTNLITTLQQIIGVTDYNIQSLPYTRPPGVSALDTRITELYNEIFGIGGSGSTSSTSLNARIQALTSSIDNLPATIYDIVGARLGPAYYNSLDHSWAETYTNIDSRITTLYNDIFGQRSFGSNKTILEQIEDLNTALFGSSSGGTASGSLIDKVEKAMGRSLDLETDETADANGNYSNSLTKQINAIKDVLGMPGGTSSDASNLIQNVDFMLDLLYGYTLTTIEEENPENPEETIITIEKIRNTSPSLNNLALQNSYVQLYKDFYLGDNGNIPTLVTNLSNSQTDINTALRTLNTTVSGYSSTLQNLSNAYREADIHVYGDNAYLILKYDVDEEDAENTEDIENKHNKYLQLPLMGGGGGTAYELDAAFTNRTLPENNIITVGKDYIVGFTWSVTQDNSNVSIDGTLTIRLNGTVVDTLYIMSNTPLTYNLGSYISSSGRNVFTITASNAATPSRTLYATIVAYNAILESSFNQSEVQTESSISYTYTASIGSGSIEKVLHISIDGTELTLSGNTSLTESSKTITFPTPSAGEHLMSVWFSANVGTTQNPNKIYSDILTYGILCGTSLERVLLLILLKLQSNNMIL